MKRTMSEEQKAKIAEAHAAKMEKRKDVLRIGTWQVFQSDDDNWTIRDGDDGDPRYYPTKATALHAVMHRRIGETQAKSIADVLVAVKKAEAEILAAVAR